MKIGLLSDTHGYLDDRIKHHLSTCDEIWHAGDIGRITLLDELSEIADLRAVHGNIDNHEIRKLASENQFFKVGNLKVFMTHIGGYPGRYNPRVLALIKERKPDVFICGHSHILKVMQDKNHKLLHINPGAAGIHGFHKMRTLIRFQIIDSKICDMEVVELGLRGELKTT